MFSARISSFLVRHAGRVTITFSGSSFLLELEHNRVSQCDGRRVGEPLGFPSQQQDGFYHQGQEGKVFAEEAEKNWYFNLFPKRQLFVPRLEYPLWDSNWDHKQPIPLSDLDQERQRQRNIRKHGITRHIILVRHGQYDETHKEDDKRVLTPLGREQAHLTGQRIAEMIRGYEDQTDANTTSPTGAVTNAYPCHVRFLRVSDLTRAKETAEIIAQHLPSTVLRVPPDPLLNEARPCHTIPGSKASTSSIQKTDEGHAQVEAAFQKYFYRLELDPKDNSPATPASATALSTPQLTDTTTTPPHIHDTHEFEIIVCHANVIRYFLCRALQLPPEAWLRFCNFNCSLTYLTIRPTGSVSCRMFGDIGHLPLNKCTFSQHHGLNW